MRIASLIMGAFAPLAHTGEIVLSITHSDTTQERDQQYRVIVGLFLANDDLLRMEQFIQA
jgi:hypothetical protein